MTTPWLENLPSADYDAALIEGWWTADLSTRGEPPESAAIDRYEYAHENGEAWPLVDEDVLGMGRDQARKMMTSLEVKKLRHVATPAGVDRYGKPIGSPIIGGKPSRVDKLISEENEKLDARLAATTLTGAAGPGPPAPMFGNTNDPRLAVDANLSSTQSVADVYQMTDEQIDYFMSGRAASDRAAGRALRFDPDTGHGLRGGDTSTLHYTSPSARALQAVTSRSGVGDVVEEIAPPRQSDKDEYGRYLPPTVAAAKAKAKAAKGKNIGSLKLGREAMHRRLVDDDFPPETAEWVMSTFERDDWPNGLQTVVDPADTTYSSDGRYLYVSGNIRDKNNNEVGVFTRSYDRNTQDNAYLGLHPEVQGQGFAEAFYRETEASAAEQGIKTVTVHANIDVGGYAWAERGFDWDRDHDPGEVIGAFRPLTDMGMQSVRERAAKWTQQQRDEVAEINRRLSVARHTQSWADIPSPKEIADVGRESPWTVTTKAGVQVSMWPGKQIMLGSDWHGKKPINTGFESKGYADDWNRRVMASLADAADAFVPGDSFDPHGDESDLNLMLADLLLWPAGETKDWNPVDHPRDHAGRFTDSLPSVAARMTRGGGATISQSGSFPKSGYVVAIRGTSKIIPEAEFEGDAGRRHIRDYLREHQAAMDANPRMHLGTWHDKDHGEYVLDLVELHEDRDEAVAAGVAGNQQAIFDLSTFEEIPTGGTGDREEKLRRVATQAGVRRYHLPIGSPIFAHADQEGLSHVSRDVTQGRVHEAWVNDVLGVTGGQRAPKGEGPTSADRRQAAIDAERRRSGLPTSEELDAADARLRERIIARDKQPSGGAEDEELRGEVAGTMTEDQLFDAREQAVVRWAAGDWEGGGAPSLAEYFARQQLGAPSSQNMRDADRLTHPGVTEAQRRHDSEVRQQAITRANERADEAITRLNEQSVSEQVRQGRDASRVSQTDLAWEAAGAEWARGSRSQPLDEFLADRGLGLESDRPADGHAQEDPPLTRRVGNAVYTHPTQSPDTGQWMTTQRINEGDRPAPVPATREVMEAFNMMPGGHQVGGAANLDEFLRGRVAAYGGGMDYYTSGAAEREAETTLPGETQAERRHRADIARLMAGHWRGGGAPAPGTPLSDAEQAAKNEPTLPGLEGYARPTTAEDLYEYRRDEKHGGRYLTPAMQLAKDKAKKAGGKPIGKLLPGDDEDYEEQEARDSVTLAENNFPQETADFVMSTFERDDWPDGMETVVNPGETYFTGGGTSLYVTGDVYKDGVDVGDFVRSIDADNGSMENEYLVLDKEEQGFGFAEAFYRETEESVSRQGIDTITVHADIDIGGYAWAERGFQWDQEEQYADGIAQRFLDKMGSTGFLEPEPYMRDNKPAAEFTEEQNDELDVMRARLEEAVNSGDWGDMPTPKELADIGRDTPWTTYTVNGKEIPMWPGKRLMLGSDWLGNRRVLSGFESKAAGQDPATRWNRRVMAHLDDAKEAFIPGDSYQPHDGGESDLNLLLVDLLLPPENVDWTPDERDTKRSPGGGGQAGETDRRVLRRRTGRLRRRADREDKARGFRSVTGFAEGEHPRDYRGRFEPKPGAEAPRTRRAPSRAPSSQPKSPQAAPTSHAESTPAKPTSQPKPTPPTKPAPKSPTPKPAAKTPAKPKGGEAHKAASTHAFSVEHNRKGHEFLRSVGAAGPDAQPGAAKPRSVNAIAKRLDNEDDWEQFRTAQLGVGAPDPGAYGDVSDEARMAALRQETLTRLNMWSMTSGDHNPYSVMMQRAVAEEFDTGGNPDVFGLGKAGGPAKLTTRDPHKPKDSIEVDPSDGAAIMATQWPEVRGFYRTFARRQYEQTQAEFAEEGVTHVSVYRGMMPVPGMPWSEEGTRPMDLMPMNSWTSDLGVSRDYAQQNAAGKVLVTHVPVSRVIGTARTGWGNESAAEYVVLNGPGNIAVYNHDNPDLPTPNP